MFSFFLLSEGFHDLIHKVERGERAVKAFSLSTVATSDETPRRRVKQNSIFKYFIT